MLEEVKGIVLRVTDIGEADRLITIYTEEKGLISALAKGARTLKSRKFAATAQFCYSTFTLGTQSERSYIKEAFINESFFGLRENLETLALAGYIIEVVLNVATADPEPELLRLVLNSLYAISYNKFSPAKVKAAFEMRCAAILGFMPDVLACHTCGEKDGEFVFDIMAGAIECQKCRRKAEREHTSLTDEHESHIVHILSSGAKTALVYSIYSPLEKLFSFKIGEEDMHLFTKAAESYLLNHLERGFKTLDFYNEVKI